VGAVKIGGYDAVTAALHSNFFDRTTTMPLISMREMLDHAAENGYGIPAFNVNNLEQVQAVMAAAGYAAATGRLGVALVGRGPAMANAVHGTLSAAKSGLPVLVISGDAALGRGVVNALGPDLKSFPAAAVTRACGIPTFVPPSAEAARQSLADAVAEASLGKTAVLLLPTDIQVGYATAAEGPSPVKLLPAAKPQPARAASIATATRLLRDSRRLIIVAGVGAYRSGAREAIEALLQRGGFTTGGIYQLGDLAQFRAHARMGDQGCAASPGHLGTLKDAVAPIQHRRCPIKHQLGPFLHQLRFPG
jgi:thiamine pyrophosphate-dependent acetolactate synthase large subunit-like protein